MDIKTSNQGNCDAFESHPQLLGLKSTTKKEKEVSPLTKINRSMKKSKKNDDEKEGDEEEDEEDFDDEEISREEYLNLLEDSDFFEEKLEDTIETSVEEYICGFIVFKLKKTLQCVECKSILAGQEASFAFLELKLALKGHLVIPSKIATLVCSRVETELQNSIEKNGLEIETGKIIASHVLKSFEDEMLLFTHKSNPDHKMWLLEILIQKYLKVRLSYLSKKITDKTSHRQQRVKLTQFEGQ